MKFDYLDFSSFCGYVVKYLNITYGWYAQYLGMEIPLIFVGSTGNVDFMAAWVVIFNIQNFFWVIASGAAMIPRTDMGIAIGERNIHKAQKVANMSIVLTTIMGAVFFIMSTVGYKKLPLLLTSIPSVLEIIEPMVLMASLFFFCTGYLPTVYCILRTIGNFKRNHTFR